MRLGPGLGKQRKTKYGPGDLSWEMEQIHARRDKRNELRERTGCCNCRYVLEVVDYSWSPREPVPGRVIGSRKYVRCSETGLDCQGYKAELVCQLFSHIQGGKRMSKEARGLISPDALKRCREIERSVRDIQTQIAECEAEGDDTSKSLIQSAGIGMLRQLFTPDIIAVLRQAEGSPLGYKTDRDKKPEKGKYTDDEIKDALIEARLRGFRVTGNEMNVIAGNFYATQAGLQRVVNEHPGVANLRLQPGVPNFSKLPDGKPNPTTMLVPYRVVFQFNPNWRDQSDQPAWREEVIECLEKDGFDERIPVKVDPERPSADAALGKAKRKALARVYQFLLGEQIRDADEDALNANYTVVSEERQ